VHTKHHTIRPELMNEPHREQSYWRHQHLLSNSRKYPYVKNSEYSSPYLT